MGLSTFVTQPGLAQRAAGVQNNRQKVAAIKRRILELQQYDPPLTTEQAAELAADLLAPFARAMNDQGRGSQ